MDTALTVHVADGDFAGILSAERSILHIIASIGRISAESPLASLNVLIDEDRVVDVDNLEVGKILERMGGSFAPLFRRVTYDVLYVARASPFDALGVRVPGEDLYEKSSHPVCTRHHVGKTNLDSGAILRVRHDDVLDVDIGYLFKVNEYSGASSRACSQYPSRPRIDQGNQLRCRASHCS